MKTYNFTLTIREVGTKNVIRIKGKKVVAETVDNILDKTVRELIDNPRKELVEKLKNAKGK